MHQDELVDSVLKSHRISFVAPERGDEQYRVSVAFPDLRSAPREMWGDWGPMYTISIPEDQEIELTIEKTDGAQQSRSSIAVEHLKVESPMKAAVREITPLSIALPLFSVGMLLKIFYDSDGHAVGANLCSLPGETGRWSAFEAELLDSDETLNEFQQINHFPPKMAEMATPIYAAE